jgi:tetratricopeptide (TPR) repeat protein
VLNRILWVISGVAILCAQQQPKWKDRTEYDLYNSVLQTQNDPNKQLQILNTWKEKYPDSDYKVVRAGLFAKDYLALNQPAQAIKASQEALASNPKDANAMLNILRAAPYVQPTTAEAQKAGEDAANAIINNWDTLKPEGVSDADWAKAKGEIEPLAQYTLAWVKVTQKDYASAEKPLRAALASTGNALVPYGLATYWLGTGLYTQHKVPEGLYEIARSVAYSGPGALDAATRAKADAFLGNAYEGFHGDKTGLNELKEQAAKTQFPPDGFSIKSVKEIDEEKQAASAGFAAQHPDLALWRLIRTTLQGEGGASYFEQSMKAAMLPPPTGDFKQFKAKLIAQPNPKELLVNIDNEAGDATLVFAAPLRAKVEPGTEIEFAGVVDGYTKEPYNVRFTVEPKDIHGLPAAGPGGAHKTTTRR